jgi:hypothetical protein
MKMNFLRYDWKWSKREYWLCLIVLAVINVIKGKYEGATFFLGIVAVWATAAEWLRQRNR